MQQNSSSRCSGPGFPVNGSGYAGPCSGSCPCYGTRGCSRSRARPNAGSCSRARSPTSTDASHDRASGCTSTTPRS